MPSCSSIVVDVGEKSGPTSVSIEEPRSSMKSNNMSEKTKDIMNFNPNAEDFDVHSDSSNNDSENSVDDDVHCESKTPLERYVLITEKKIPDKRVLIAKLQEKENDIEKRINRVKSNPQVAIFVVGTHGTDVYTMGKCTSVFKCGGGEIPRWRN